MYFLFFILRLAKKISFPAADDLFRVSFVLWPYYSKPGKRQAMDSAYIFPGISYIPVRSHSA